MQTLEILIIEDNIKKIEETKIFIGYAINYYNEAVGFKYEQLNPLVTEANTLNKAYELLNKGYDLIILDYLFAAGTITGFDLAKMIREGLNKGKFGKITPANKEAYILGNSCIWCGGREFADTYPAYRIFINNAVNPELGEDYKKDKYLNVVFEIAKRKLSLNQPDILLNEKNNME